MTGHIRLLADNLEKWIDLNQWNRQQFADALGVTPEFVSLLLNGKRFPSLSTLEDICRVTGLDIGNVLVFDRAVAGGEEGT